MPNRSPHLHLAVALDGAGWHPAAWREPDARPAGLFTARYWTDLVAEAEAGLLDFVTIEDGLAVQSDDWSGPDERTDRVRGRLDAVIVAARVAPTSRSIGLVPTAVATHTEPFHLSKAIATLDYVSGGRAGVRVQVSTRPDEAAHVGRRPVLGIDEAVDEAADYVEVVRRLWDSWQDDAEIRDAATGRFVDRDRLHHIDFAGQWFSVKGPSITPRPPQGQPLVAAADPDLIARSADIGFVVPHTVGAAADVVRAVGSDAGRRSGSVQLFADLLVHLDHSDDAASDRRARLDDLAGTPYASDARVFVGTPAGLADLLLDWHSAGLTGFRLRPAALPHDLVQISRVLVPELQRRDAFRSAYPTGGWAASLRGLLGLPRPVNRYAVERPEGVVR